MSDFVFEKEEGPATRIKVVGVGGGGSNAVDSMVNIGLPGVEFYVVNTDTQALRNAKTANRIQIGADVTHGLGAGGDPGLGEQAAMADRDTLTAMLEDGDMVFITACMGGGTGTGATPVIAELAKSLGLLTVCIVTKPFQFEGPRRKSLAQQGIDRLRDYVDALIVVMNDKLLEMVSQKTTLLESFGMVNQILAQGVHAISDLICMPGLINADFQDVRAVMGETGGAVLGFGSGKGESRAVEAIKKACSASLQEKIVINGARRVLVNISGGPDMTLHEVNEAASLVYEAADPDANIIFSAVINEKMTDEINVTIIATGFGEELAKMSAGALGATQKKPAARPSASASAFSSFEPRLPAAKSPLLPLRETPKEEHPVAPRAEAEHRAPEASAEDELADIFDGDSESAAAEMGAAASPWDTPNRSKGRPAPARDKDSARDLLKSWSEDYETSAGEDEEAKPEPAPAPAAASRPPATPEKKRGFLRDPGISSGGGDNLEIPAILRRRKSFYS